MPSMDPGAGRRRLLAAFLLGVLGGAGGLALLPPERADVEPNVARAKPLLTSMDGLDVLVAGLPGPADNPNAVVLEVRLVRPDRLAPVPQRQFAVDLSGYPTDSDRRSEWLPCRVSEAGESVWTCGYVVDGPGLWHFDLRVTQRVPRGAAPVVAGTVKALVDVSDAVQLHGHAGTQAHEDRVPEFWVAGAIALAALGIGSRARRRAALRT